MPRKGTERRDNVEIRTLKAAEIKAAEYNPRRDLQPEDAEYEKLRRSIEEFGYIEPIIWNERSGNVVGGHQRLKVLLEKGVEAIEAVVVDLDEKDEKILNVLLNKVKGRWDIGKLADLLQQLDEAGAMELTGFEVGSCKASLCSTTIQRPLWRRIFPAIATKKSAAHSQ